MDMDRRHLLQTGVAAGAGALLGAGIGSPAQAVPTLSRVLARDLQIPWGIAFLPGGDALVTERNTGRIHLVRRSGGRRAVGSVSGLRPRDSESGLLGIALHPGFRRNRWVYLYMSTRSDNRVVRMRYVDGRLRDQQNVFTGIPVSSTHNGGQLLFGRDGLLYVATGDAGDSSRAQDLDSLGGKILRITPGGEVPAGNPFGRRPVYSRGHRNVQGLAWDGRGRLWATEFGQSTRDELNIIVAGGNYGWPRVEGGDGSGPYRDPFVTWSPTSYCSPSGLTVVGGFAYAGALAGQALMRVDISGSGARTKRRFLHDRVGRIRAVRRAPDGSLWITTSNARRSEAVAADDRVIRVRL
jgi:glucose/arabinose dehydrogenase